MGLLPALPRWIPACAGMTKSIVCEAEADQVLCGFEFVMVLCAGVLSLDGVREEVNYQVAVACALADFLL